MAKLRDSERLEVCRRIQAEFGDRFRGARKAAGLMQKNVAGQMNLTRTSISNIERGTQRLYLDQVYQAAHVLKTSVQDLLPSVEEVYRTPEIRTPSDAPLTAKAVQIAQEMISRVRTGNHLHTAGRKKNSTSSRVQ